MDLPHDHIRSPHIGKLRSIPLMIAAVIIAFFSVSCGDAEPSRQHDGGRIAISRWIPDGRGDIRAASLKGTWLFRRGDDPSYRDSGLDDSGWEPIEVPLNWFRLPPGRKHHGYGWYRLHIAMPEMPGTLVPGIELGWIDDADEVYCNGRLIGRTGLFPGDLGYGAGRHSYDRTRIYPVPRDLFRPGSDTVLAVRVHSMDYDTAGIYMGDQRIGSYRSLVDRFHLTENIIIVMSALYLIVALYHAFLFFRRPRTFENLFFALFTASVGLVTLLRSQTKYFIIDNFAVLKFTEYCAEAVLIGLFLHFLVYYFEERFYNRASIAFDALIGGSLVYLSLSYPDVTRYFYLSDYVTYWIYLAAMLYSLWYLFRQRKRNDARIMLGAFIIVAATVAADILIGMTDVSVPWMAHYGFLAFILAIAGALGDRFVNLYNGAVRAARERSELIAIQQELRIAREIQLSILPEKTPDVPGLAIAARYIPMGAVGGDFYDFQVIPDGSGLGVLIADVTGHGVPASLIASMMKVAFSFQRERLADPALLMKNLNSMFYDKIRNNYITAGYVMVDRERMTLRHASAGHLPVLHCSGAGERVDELKPRGILLGMNPSAEYVTQTRAISRGDRIVIFTDGIVEAASVSGELFGDRRFLDLIHETGGLGLEEFADRIISEVNGFIPAGREPQDDITLVVIDVK